MKKTRVKGIDCGLVANIKARDRNRCEMKGVRERQGKDMQAKGGQGEDVLRLLVLKKKQRDRDRGEDQG